jgi:hypothetical protein
MSIYATVAHFGIKRFGDKSTTEILAQSVPPHIDYTGPEWDFLPPPVDPNGTTARAVVFVEPAEEKGTDRCGQEYVRPLLMLTGEQYEKIRFIDLVRRLEDALDRRYGQRPSANFLRPDGSEEKLY